jgi:sugar (pentulose or hexulose) kinase
MMFLGLDFGTSGARACVTDSEKTIVWEQHVAYPDMAAQTPLDWRTALHALLSELPKDIAAQLQGLAIDGTSGTVLLCDAELEPVSPALLYHDNRAQLQAEQLKTIVPDSHIVCTATSGLAKFLWLTQQSDINHAAYFLHQADWLSALLCGKPGISDYHNALKTGYDIEQLCWPDWVMALPHSHLLPQVFSPGKVIGRIQPDIAAHFGIHPQCAIHAGTTDSIAAFIAADGMTRRCEASGAGMPSPRLLPQSAGCASNVSEADVNQLGIGVTSLGTTLVLKQLSAIRIDAPEYGVYSHRYGDLWLMGGASNAGAGVLRLYFDDAQLAELSAQIDPLQDSPLDYYPLTRIGERFPVNDAQLAPRLEQRPGSDVEFLHGLLQGLAHIEAAGYAKLAELGAPALKRVVTNGGGAKNSVWGKMRARLLGVPISTAAVSQLKLCQSVAVEAQASGTARPPIYGENLENCLPLVHCEAAYGCALLCLNDYSLPRSISSN